jgi:hypothetical protein
MEYAVQMGSGVMINIPNLKIVSGIQKLIGRGRFTDLQTAW